MCTYYTSNHLFCHRSNTCIITCLQPTTAARTANHKHNNNHNNSISTLQDCNLTIKPCLVGSSTWRNIKETTSFSRCHDILSIGMAWSWTITIINTFLFQIWSQLLVASAALCQVIQSCQDLDLKEYVWQCSIYSSSAIIFELNLQSGSPLSPFTSSVSILFYQEPSVKEDSPQINPHKSWPGDDEASWEAEPLRELWNC